jgi:hypothetical protein
MSSVLLLERQRFPAPAFPSLSSFPTITTLVLQTNHRLFDLLTADTHTFLRIFPRICARRFFPSKQYTSHRPFPNMRSTCPYSVWRGEGGKEGGEGQSQ